MIAWFRSDRRVLLVLGIFAAALGAFYLPMCVPASAHMPTLEKWVPLWLWAAAWIADSALLLFSAITDRARPTAVAMGSAMPLLWAAIYLGGWLTGDNARGYVTALSFLILWFLMTSRFSVIHDNSAEGETSHG